MKAMRELLAVCETYLPLRRHMIAAAEAELAALDRECECAEMIRYCVREGHLWLLGDTEISHCPFCGRRVPGGK